jgi:hypothetical protein
MKHPISVDRLPQHVAKVCGPQAPEQLKTMAAKGVAPLGPVDLVTALYVLAFDNDRQLSGTARASLNSLAEDTLDGAVDQMSNTYVLDGLVQLVPRRTSTIQKALLNRALDDQTAEWIAGNSRDEPVLEMIAFNQQRLLRRPSIIEALYNNSATRMSTAERVVEFAVRSGIELNGITAFAEIKAAIEGGMIEKPVEAPLQTAEPAYEDTLVKNNLELDEWKDLDMHEVENVLEARLLGGDTGEEQERTKKIETLEQSLSKMTISGKIRVATLGSAGQRALLIRESNKLVVMAVVKSPGIRESEVTKYSTYKTLPEEALRFIAKNRDWTKHYGVKFNLVKNPRTPLEFSLRFLPHLRPSDLRSLEKDKNIPGAIAKAAKQLRATRTR